MSGLDRPTGAPATSPPTSTPPPPMTSTALPPLAPARARRWSTLRRWEDRLFARTGLEPSNRSGMRGGGKPEWLGYLLAIAIGAVTAILVEVAMNAYPIPSGGDPGQWIASSFPFVG